LSLTAGRVRRGVPLLNGLVAGTLVVLLAVVALVVRPPAPPGIAEFAPQASKPITKAPPGQAAEHGDAPGACSAGQVCALPTRMAVPAAARPTSSAAWVPSSVQCHQWPDGSVTQTFDPQSPPCIASWPESRNGNGGATAPGVTGSTIRVAFPEARAPRTDLAVIRALVTFVNQSYQLYGRRLVLASSNPPSGTPQLARAAATGVAQTKPFASLSREQRREYHDTLAEHGVVSFATDFTMSELTSAGMSHHAPYEWSVYPAVDEWQRTLASFACTSLAARPARWAGPGSQGKRRAFALLRAINGGNGDRYMDVQVLRQALAGCRLSPDVVDYDVDQDDALYTRAGVAVRKLRDDGVTTLVCLCWGAHSELALAASQANYFPEWILGGGAEDIDYWAGVDKQQDPHMFGIAVRNKPLQPGQAMWERAASTAAPTLRPNEDARTFDRYAYEDFYREFNLLASGIQAAGPHLTPASFEQALQELRFPNPGHGLSPTWQSGQGYAQGRFTSTLDVALHWWSQTSQTSSSGTTLGTWCYVGRGARFGPGGWPSDAALFDPDQPCR